MTLERLDVLRCIECRQDISSTDDQKERKYDLPQLQEHVAMTHCEVSRFKCICCEIVFATEFMALSHFAGNLECKIEEVEAISLVDPDKIIKCYRIMNDSLREMICNVIVEALNPSHSKEERLEILVTPHDSSCDTDSDYPPKPPPKFLKGTSISWPLFPKRRAVFSHSDGNKTSFWNYDADETSTGTEVQDLLEDDDVFEYEPKKLLKLPSKPAGVLVAKSPLSLPQSDPVMLSTSNSSQLIVSSSVRIKSEIEDVEDMLRKRDQSDPSLAPVNSPLFQFPAVSGSLVHSQNVNNNNDIWSFPTSPSSPEYSWSDQSKQIYHSEANVHPDTEPRSSLNNDLTSQRPRVLQFPHPLAQNLTIKIPKEDSTNYFFPRGHENGPRNAWNFQESAVMVVPKPHVVPPPNMVPPSNIFHPHQNIRFDQARQLTKSYFTSRPPVPLPRPFYVHNKPVVKSVSQEPKYGMHMQPVYFHKNPLNTHSTIAQSAAPARIQYTTPKYDSRPGIMHTVYEVRPTAHQTQYRGEDYRRKYI